MRGRIVTLLSDFGDRDGYAAAMKGVILSLAPDATLVDAVHDIPPYDIAAGAWSLAQYWALYPKGTIHLAVVDPGVGAGRKAVLVEADGRLIVAPDNGLSACAVRQARETRYWALREEAHRQGEVSATFHGRDIFSHVCGLLASGQARPDEVGVPLAALALLPCAEAKVDGSVARGAILHVDRFGNLISSLTREHLQALPEGVVKITLGDVEIGGLSRTYADGPRGQLMALIGSSGHLEVALNSGSAAQHTGLGRETPLVARVD